MKFTIPFGRALSSYRQKREVTGYVRKMEREMKRVIDLSAVYGWKIGGEYMNLYETALTNDQKEVVMRDLKRCIEESVDMGMMPSEVEKGVGKTFPWYILSRERGIHNL